MQACYYPYTLEFRRPSGTSRGVLTRKDTWLLLLRDADAIGIGECNMFRGLSYDDRPTYESALAGLHPLTEDRSPYPWVHDLLMERAAPSEQAELWHHCRAVCAQIHLMRGPANRGEPVEVR